MAATLGGQIDVAEIRNGQLHIKGCINVSTSNTSSAIARLFLSEEAVDEKVITLSPTAGETWVSGGEYLLEFPLDNVSHLMNLDIQVKVTVGDQHIFFHPPKGTELAKLKFSTLPECFDAIQNPAFRIKDRLALMRLSVEALKHFDGQPELSLSVLCILAYGYMERPSERSRFLPTIFELEGKRHALLAVLEERLRVRWAASAAIGVAYLQLSLGDLSASRKTFEEVAGLAPSIGLWPSSDLNIARAIFAAGCLAQISGDKEAAIIWWSSCMDFAKVATSCKVFDHYFKAEETHAVWAVALACSACSSIVKSKLGRGNRVDQLLSDKIIVPSKVCGYLLNIDKAFKDST